MEKEIPSITNPEDTLSKPKNSFKFLKVIAIILLILLSYMFYFSNFFIKVKETSITDEDLPKSFDGLKIVVLNNLYYGTSIKENNLKLIVKKVNTLKPDIIIFTGNLIDKSIEKSSKIKSELTYYLSTLESKIVKIAIKGCDDDDDYQDIITNSGFTFLSDEEYKIYSNTSEEISFIGINNANDLTSTNYQIALLSNADKIDNLENNNYNLVLASKDYTTTKYHKNFYNLKKTKMDVGNNLGTSGINLRISNPTINFYRLYQY